MDVTRTSNNHKDATKCLGDFKFNVNITEHSFELYKTLIIRMKYIETVAKQRFYNY